MLYAPLECNACVHTLFELLVLPNADKPLLVLFLVGFWLAYTQARVEK
jgi:hypothetical protein